MKFPPGTVTIGIFGMLVKAECVGIVSSESFAALLQAVFQAVMVINKNKRQKNCRGGSRTYFSIASLAQRNPKVSFLVRLAKNDRL